MSEAPWYYPIFLGPTPDEVEEALGPAPFRLTAAQIVELLPNAGYAPNILDPSREMLPMPGVTTTVQQEGRTFLVSVDEPEGLISVQELADAAYPDE